MKGYTRWKITSPSLKISLINDQKPQLEVRLYEVCCWQENRVGIIDVQYYVILLVLQFSFHIYIVVLEMTSVAL